MIKLTAARWLTTKQIADLCFPDVSVEMARRRLRLLGEGSYVFSRQTNQMAEALHCLGPKGKELLTERGWTRPIRLERMPPKSLDHFLGINDIRVAVERTAAECGIEIGFFFAHWELQQQGWAYRIIPDAACHLKGCGKSITVLFEYDRGEESPEYVVRTKFRPYAQGLDGFPFSEVLVVVDTAARLKQLREYAERHVKTNLFSFILLDGLRQSGSLGKWFS